ncbi:MULTISPECIES: DUF2917 domain-containing protein [Acidovorax]|uniref:DUF2917 domain-containing protein n=1 Tax=Acidovorax soli TaxID=592050 RepID=A0A1H4D7X1_9BURK|nr:MULTISPECIES: DUF2917 domain-containing protein [Acidovorax]SEA68865.1 Protein of unknown function [Acidovorax soli]
MSTPHVLPLQPSVLAVGQALSLRPRCAGVLEVAQGRVWLTLRGPWGDQPGTEADHVLQAGERLRIAAGQHAVVEAWGPCADTAAAALRWSGVTAAPAVGAASSDWEGGVVQPLRDLRHALGQGGRALGAAMADVAGAGGRCVAGLARFALHRTVPRRQRGPCAALP